MKLYLPLPPKSCSGNPGNLGRWQKAKDRKECRRLAYLLLKDVRHYESVLWLKSEMQKSGMRLRVQFDGYPAQRGLLEAGRCCPTDDDNGVIACKGYRDGIADALGIDDKQMTSRWFRFTTKGAADRRREQGDVPEFGCVIVTFHPYKESSRG